MTDEPCYSWNVFHAHRLGDRAKYLEGMYSVLAGGVSKQTFISTAPFAFRAAGVATVRYRDAFRQPADRVRPRHATFSPVAGWQHAERDVETGVPDAAETGHAARAAGGWSEENCRQRESDSVEKIGPTGRD